MSFRTTHLLLIFLLLSSTGGTAAANEPATAQTSAGVSNAKEVFSRAMKSIEGDEGEYPAKVLSGIKLLTEAAEQGYAPAQFKLGYYFYTGPLSYDCLKQEPEKAYYWFGKAAAQDHLEAQYELATLYDPETGFKRYVDRDKYVAWMSKAAELGYVKAQTHLARMYELGESVPLDKNLARQWYAKAAAKGDKRAAVSLRKLSQ